MWHLVAAVGSVRTATACGKGFATGTERVRFSEETPRVERYCCNCEITKAGRKAKKTLADEPPVARG